MVINGELVPTEYYVMAKRVQMPVLVFCLPIDEKRIDANHKLIKEPDKIAIIHLLVAGSACIGSRVHAEPL